MSPKAATYTERVSVFFTQEQLAQIKVEAERLGLAVGVYIRMATMEKVNTDV